MTPHKLTITEPFYIGKTEVTNAQHRKFMDASGHDGKSDRDPAYDLYLRHWRGGKPHVRGGRPSHDLGLVEEREGVLGVCSGSTARLITTTDKYGNGTW